MTPKILLVLTGKTASGKDSVITRLLSRFPNLKKVVTTTSRTQRDEEIDGADYNFVPESVFRQKIQGGDFIEHVTYGGNLYGTEKAQITNNLKYDLIWKIDPSRAGEVRDFIKRSFPTKVAEELIKRVLVIYITVPDEIILQRLKSRGLTEGEIQKRMADDARIWQQSKDNYDFLVENIPGKLAETVDKIINIIENRL